MSDASATPEDTASVYADGVASALRQALGALAAAVQQAEARLTDQINANNEQLGNRLVALEAKPTVDTGALDAVTGALTEVKNSLAELQAKPEPVAPEVDTAAIAEQVLQVLQQRLAAH